MKDIEGYEGLYAVTEDGHVWSYRKNRFLSDRPTAQGYHRVVLCKDGKQTHKYIHQIVASTYIPNPNGYTIINHKDENPGNNCVDNLEWCDQKYNINYGTRTERVAAKLSKSIYCVELDRVFKSQKEAAKELDICQSGISFVLTGKMQTYKGYHWKYVN